MTDQTLSQRILHLFQPESSSQRFLRETAFHKTVAPPVFAEWPKEWINIHFKSYKRVKKLKLPQDFKSSSSQKITLQQALLQRSSCRSMGEAPLTLNQISELLFFSVGIKSRHGDNWDFSKRMYPSGGARYPVEVYLLILNSQEVPPGLYHYHFQTHSLEVLEQKNFQTEVSECYGDPWIQKAGMIVVMTGMFGRTEVKYKSRGLRHVFIEAGHIGQNFYLNATSLGLGCCGQGGHVEKRLNKVLDIDGWSESVINTVAIGTVPKKQSA